MSFNHFPLPEEQAEANAYWADRDFKKWVVRLSKGTGRRADAVTLYVGAATKDRAIKAGREGAVLMGRSWARKATAQTRLATYRDLGAERAA